MGKKIICHCEDVDIEEIHTALRQGFGDIETLRRYTGIGTGKCQGKCCIVQTLRVLASLESGGHASFEESHGLTGDPRRIQLPTIRPPVLPLRIDDIVESRAEPGSERRYGDPDAPRSDSWGEAEEERS